MKKVALFLLFLSSVFFISCSPITRASGEIIDKEGKALENVSIKISGKSVKSNNNLEFLTKSDGRYDFGEIKVSAELPTEIKMVVSKNGFKTITKDLKYGEENKDKIILEEESK